MNKPNNTIYNDLTVPKEEPSTGPNVYCCKTFAKMPARLVLYCRSLSGFMVSYMLRTDMNVAILSMMKHADSFEVLNSSCSAGLMNFTNQTAENFTWKPIDVEFSGILSGAPFLVSFPVALLFCYIADRTITYKWISATNTRKMFTCLGQVVPGIMIIIIGYLECDIDSHRGVVRSSYDAHRPGTLAPCPISRR